MKKNFDFQIKKACPAKLQRSGGFTLIELLMVITIIGILSTVILSSISSSRAKAYDSKVKQQLSSFRTAAEIYFSNQAPNSYNPSGSSINVCTAGIFNNVTAANGMPGLYIAPGSLPDFSAVYCGASADGSAYAVKAMLYSGTEYWCVDNKGSSRAISGIPTSGTFCL